jgi:membrane-associated protease RseP (regulator of RpoE activity)
MTSPYDASRPLDDHQDQRTDPATPPTPPRQVVLPILLFLATCASTYMTNGPLFCVAIMVTLTAHELGHFLQAVRYRVPTSLPFFIPMPISIIGTMGAVIGMRGGMGNRRSLFDIAITGPLAGLVPALAFSVIGLQWSEVRLIENRAESLMLGEPLIFQLLAYWTFGPLPEELDVMLHPVAFAGWVGIFITALNLIPLGQLDGGHILYALLRTKAHLVATIVFALAATAVFVLGYRSWTLMIFLLLMLGIKHPPTANDDVPLGAARTVLGWVSLLFLFVGFTPTPFVP